MAQEENKEKSILETISSLGSESDILETAEETKEQPETTLEAAVFKVWGEEQDAEDSDKVEETDSDEEVTEEEEDDGIEGTKDPDEDPSDGTEVKEEEDEDEEDEAPSEEEGEESDEVEEEEDDEEEVDTDDVEVSADDAEDDMEDEVEDEVADEDDGDDDEEDMEEAEVVDGDSEEDDAIDGAADPDQDVDKAVDSIAQTVIKAATHKAKEKLNATYGSMKEDIDALCAEDESLTEEFKTKAATIFEAAVTSKVNQHIEEIQESYVEFVNEEVNSLHEGLVDKIDSYLTYVAEQWIEKNDVAVTNVLRTEIAEAFMASLKDSFTEHYIEMPEGKTDMFDEITQQNAELSDTVESKEETIGQLAEEIISLKKEKIISDLSEGLADTQIGKFKKLTSDVVFEDVDSFTEKVKVIRESYFNKKSEKVEEEVSEKSNSATTKEVVVTETVEEENTLDPLMNTYMKAFTKLDKEAF
jgi:hypothetical protein